ncbi:MAG: ABC transporter permease [Leucobacter sp.]|nr:ABC transporter permease [Leucobacter sp.]
MALHSFSHSLRAEVTKALTLRSTQITLCAALLVPTILALASGLAFDPTRKNAFPIESHGFETAGFGQPLVILLAALIVGAEYTDGQLRTTLLATPKRGQVLAAKLTLVAVVGAVIGAVAIGAAVLVKHVALGADGLAPQEFTSAMGWNLLGVSANYALIAIVAACITVLARTYIVTLVVLVPLVLGLTISLLGVFPVLKYLPDLAGIQLLMPYPGVDLLSPIAGGVVMAAWATVLIGGSWAVARLRDTGS